MAAAEPRYTEALLSHRAEALAAVASTDVTLSDSERRILESVGEGALRSMAARVAARVTEPTRRAFMHRAGVALAASTKCTGRVTTCTSVVAKMPSGWLSLKTLSTTGQEFRITGTGAH